MFHYHRAVLSFQPRLQGAALMLFTSFTSPECSDHQRASLFCQRLDEFLLSPPELWRGVSSLHVPGHWTDSGFLFRDIGLLEVQGIDSISSTGSTCAGLERFQKCLERTAITLVNYTPEQLAKLHAPQKNVLKGVAWGHIVFARAIEPLAPWRQHFVKHLPAALFNMTAQYAIETLSTLNRRPSEIQPDYDSCGIFGPFRQVTFWHGASTLCAIYTKTDGQSYLRLGGRTQLCEKLSRIRRHVRI